jgi:hypothetical protein
VRRYDSSVVAPNLEAVVKFFDAHKNRPPNGCVGYEALSTAPE